jgi:hypothetical protein
LPPEQDLWQNVLIDTWTGLKASRDCGDFTKEIFALNVTDEFARRWITKDPEGQAWVEQMGFRKKVTFAPPRECTLSDPRPELVFSSPRDGEVIGSSPLRFFVKANATAWFDAVELFYGDGLEPENWQLLQRRRNPQNEGEVFYEWDVLPLRDGFYTLKLVLYSTEDTQAELKIHIELKLPTPTPTSTSTPTPTSTATPTPTETLTPTVTPSPTVDKFPKATEITLPPPPETLELTPLPTLTPTP